MTEETISKDSFFVKLVKILYQIKQEKLKAANDNLPQNGGNDDES